MFNRLFGTALVFLFKFALSALRRPTECRLLKAALLRNTVRKGDVVAEVAALQRRDATLRLRMGSSMRTRGAFGKLVKKISNRSFIGGRRASFINTIHPTADAAAGSQQVVVGPREEESMAPNNVAVSS